MQHVPNVRAFPYARSGTVRAPGRRTSKGSVMTECTHSLELMEDEAQVIVTQGVRWIQYDPEHKHRYRCSSCGVLAYR